MNAAKQAARPKPRTASKIPVTLIAAAVGTFVPVLVGTVALFVARDRQPEPGQTDVAKAREKVELVRRKFVERMHRFSYSAKKLEPETSGWQQLLAAKWASQLLTAADADKQDPTAIGYRWPTQAILTVYMLDANEIAAEAMTGNESFRIVWDKKVAGKTATYSSPIGAAGAAYLAAGKMSAVDLALSLQYLPNVDLQTVVTQMEAVQGDYRLAQENLLQAEGLTDPAGAMQQLQKFQTQPHSIRDAFELGTLPPSPPPRSP